MFMKHGQSQFSGSDILSSIDQSIKKEFETNHRVLSFEEYLGLVALHPFEQTRGIAQYVVDMMDHFGSYSKPETQATHGSPITRFKLFDLPIDGIAPKVVGHERVQNQLYKTLKAFARQGLNNKLILLHGPNGSAKSSIIHAMMTGLEAYCQESPGAMYSFNWIFPLERYTKGSMGMNTYTAAPESVTSFAKIPDEETAARIPCDMKDHPLLVIPPQHRRSALEQVLGAAKTEEIWNHLPNYLTKGDLCHRCKQIADTLLTTHGGDFKKVLMHIQVERIYFARRYRKGLVTIEPQLHVDAQYQQLSYNKNLGSLPASLQSLNLFTLTGDLIDGNRGLIEYSDLLKRPVDTFKYLLSACETSAVNVGNTIAYLDSLMLGSTNELQLDAFKDFPDFTSFKARIELIRVPYLMSFSEEQQIYQTHLPQIAGDKHVTPHVAATLSLWAVLTRLKKPNTINFPPNLSNLIAGLKPLEKAKLYDTGELPPGLTPEERKILRASLDKLREEYSNIPYYEGRMGASARELKTVLFDASQNSEFPCLSPLAVLREIEELTKRTSEYEFLKQEIKDGYHHAADFIHIVREEYINQIDREVRDSIGIYNSVQWEEFLKKYVLQISIALKKEKIKNPITGKMEDPDFALIEEFEKIVEGPEDIKDKQGFRQNIISQVGAWSLDHPNEAVNYARVFPDFWKKLEKHYFESQKALLTKMSDALLVYDSDTIDPNSEGSSLARKTVETMKSKLGYCQACAKEVIIFLMQQRY